MRAALDALAEDVEAGRDAVAADFRFHLEVADTLPPGLHFGYGFWQFRIGKMPVTIVPPSSTARAR